MVRLSPLEFLDRLAALVPPPRVHRHRYHGVLAPSSPLRPLVTASAGEAAALPVPQTTPRLVSTLSRRTARPRSRRVSSRWAVLLARIHHARPSSAPGTARSVVAARSCG
ncbi:MAG: transposase [Gemmatimonadota bacterium]